jgi:hypothetical protein
MAGSCEPSGSVKLVNHEVILLLLLIVINIITNTIIIVIFSHHIKGHCQGAGVIPCSSGSPYNSFLQNRFEIKLNSMLLSSEDVYCSRSAVFCNSAVESLPKMPSKYYYY